METHQCLYLFIIGCLCSGGVLQELVGFLKKTLKCIMLCCLYHILQPRKHSTILLGDYYSTVLAAAIDDSVKQTTVRLDLILDLINTYIQYIFTTTKQTMSLRKTVRCSLQSRSK